LRIDYLIESIAIFISFHVLLQLPACRYTKGAWSECNTATNQRSRSLTLKKGDSSCEQSKTITKKCKKGQFSFIIFVNIYPIILLPGVLIAIHQSGKIQLLFFFIPIRLGSNSPCFCWESAEEKLIFVGMGNLVEKNSVPEGAYAHFL
jgi:hypothetical protein